MLRLENVIGVFKTILDDDSSISLKIACAAVKVYLFFPSKIFLKLFIISSTIPYRFIIFFEILTCLLSVRI